MVESGFTKEQLDKVIADQRKKAIMNLRRSGSVVRYTSENTIVEIIVDDLQVTYTEEGGFRFSVDGQDITQYVRGVNIRLDKNNIPMIQTVFLPENFLMRRTKNGLKSPTPERKIISKRRAGRPPAPLKEDDSL